MRKALVIGGSRGIGLSIVIELIKRGYNHVYIVDKKKPNKNDVPPEYQSTVFKNISFEQVNLIQNEYSFLCKHNDIDTLVITAGFGRVAPFYNLTSVEINNLVFVNLLAPLNVINHYYNKIHSSENFYTLVMGSIAGHISSPLFSVYGSSKSGLCSFVDSVNIELEAEGFKNRILDISPGSISHTGFNGGKTDCYELEKSASVFVDKMFQRETLFIPDYDKVYKEILRKNYVNRREFGLSSYRYKMDSGRVTNTPQVVIGYLSGTFDLFHIGHLNLLKKAKKECDYLIVGVHRSGSWKGKETFIPFEERCEIIKSIRYVDEVHESFLEDSDAWFEYKYDKLFVGSDYKGSDRFKRYEAFFKDKNVKIVYFPYTKGTSSTELRDKIKK